MLVGVPKEIKTLEFRVGLVPASVREYVAAGHQVLMETGAGSAIGMNDDVYRAAGAEIAADAAEVFARSDMIVKVKEPQLEEIRQMRAGQILFTYLHLAPDPAQAYGLLEAGVTAVAYETVTDENGGLPLLAPMSEVAGRLSVEAAAQALRFHAGGCGLLMGGVPGVAPAKVVVVGGGVVGTQAARMAVGLGADVTILDRSLPRLRHLDDLFDGRVRTLMASKGAIEEVVGAADAVIGAVLVPGASAPKLVSRDLVGQMRQGRVLVDVAIDQGGCFETSKPTTHADPTYQVDGIVHYCVANMPGSVPLTSSLALNNATLPYGLAIANGGKTILSDPKLRSGINVHRGKVTNQAVAESLNLPVQELAIAS